MSDPPTATIERWNFRFNLSHILCLLLIKCIRFIYISLNLVKNILATRTVTWYVTIKIEQTPKFSNIFLCFFISPSSIEHNPLSFFYFFLFPSSLFLCGSQWKSIFLFISLFLIFFLYTYCIRIAVKNLEYILNFVSIDTTNNLYYCQNYNSLKERYKN